MTSLIVEDLWNKSCQYEKEFEECINAIIDKGIIKVDGSNRDLQHIQVLNIVDEIEEKRNRMIRVTNLWREYKRNEEDTSQQSKSKP